MVGHIMYRIGQISEGQDEAREGAAFGIAASNLTILLYSFHSSHPTRAAPELQTNILTHAQTHFQHKHSHTDSHTHTCMRTLGYTHTHTHAHHTDKCVFCAPKSASAFVAWCQEDSIKEFCKPSVIANVGGRGIHEMCWNSIIAKDWRPLLDGCQVCRPPVRDAASVCKRCLDIITEVRREIICEWFAAALPATTNAHAQPTLGRSCQPPVPRTAAIL